MSTIAIIVAGGSGTRFGAKKQFIEVAGKPLYYYSIKAFRPYVDHIILAVPEEDVGIVEPFDTMVIAGGKNRYNSVYNAIKAIRNLNSAAEFSVDDDSIIMIHDGARPCITGEVIDRVKKDTQQYGAAVAVTKVTDTIRTIEGELIDRSKLRAMQTPQAFKYSILRDAFDRLMSLPQEAIDSLRITDDVQVVDSMMGVAAHMSDGDPDNIKVTTPSDLQSLHIS